MWCFLYCSIKREQSSFAGDGDRQRDTDRFTRQHPDRHRFRLTPQKENHQRYREREVEDSNLCLSSVKLHQRELLLHFFSLMRHPRIIGDSEFIINRCKLIHWQGRWPLRSRWPQTSAEYRSLSYLDPISLYRAFLKPSALKTFTVMLMLMPTLLLQWRQNWANPIFFTFFYFLLWLLKSIGASQVRGEEGIREGMLSLPMWGQIPAAFVAPAGLIVMSSCQVPGARLQERKKLSILRWPLSCCGTRPCECEISGWHQRWQSSKSSGHAVKPQMMLQLSGRARSHPTVDRELMYLGHVGPYLLQSKQHRQSH